MNKIAVVGECIVELNLLGKDTYKQVFSGDSLNCSISLKNILEESEIQYITALGEDELSKEMLNFLNKQDIKTNYINILKNKSPIVYINNKEANPTYFSSDLLDRDIFESKMSEHIMNKLMDFDLIYFSSNSIAMMSENGRVSFFKIIKKLRMYGVKIVFNSIYIPMMHESNDTARKLYEISINYADILLTNTTDEKNLWSNITVQEITKRAQFAGCQEIVIECENQEIAYSLDGESKKIKIKELSDKNVFNSAYLAMRLKSNSIKESIINATKINY